MNKKHLFILILAALTIFMVTSCFDKKTLYGQVQLKREVYSQELDSTSEYYTQRYSIYTLEGCEYIKVDVGNTTWGSHKGNCKNPIHK